jgi:hypothetical protein
MKQPWWLGGMQVIMITAETMSSGLLLGCSVFGLLFPKFVNRRNIEEKKVLR